LEDGGSGVYLCVGCNKMMKYFSRIFTFSTLLFLAYPITVSSQSSPEYLDWKTLKINNKLPLLCKKVDLITLLGKPDKIVALKDTDACISYFDKDPKLLFWGDTEFETSDSIAVISSIDFESNKIRLVSPIITLDNSVTFEKIKRLFPKAANEAETDMIEKKGKLIEVISVKISPSKKDSDYNWLLFFRAGKLIRIDYWTVC
jgi:hypothetical protein